MEYTNEAFVRVGVPYNGGYRWDEVLTNDATMNIITGKRLYMASLINGIFVIGGMHAKTGGVYFTSVDGLDWTRHPTGKCNYDY